MSGCKDADRSIKDVFCEGDFEQLCKLLKSCEELIIDLPDNYWIEFGRGPDIISKQDDYLNCLMEVIFHPNVALNREVGRLQLYLELTTVRDTVWRRLQKEIEQSYESNNSKRLNQLVTSAFDKETMIGDIFYNQCLCNSEVDKIFNTEEIAFFEKFGFTVQTTTDEFETEVLEIKPRVVAEKTKCSATEDKTGEFASACVVFASEIELSNRSPGAEKRNPGKSL